MATIATLCEPVTVGVEFLVEPLPVGNFTTMGWDGTRDGISAFIGNRFPTPSSAIGFLTDEPDEELIPGGTTPPYYIVSALAPEGDFLEPTRGQIWPRIG